MDIRHALKVHAAAAALSIVAASTAAYASDASSAGDSTLSDLKAQIEQLQAKVQQLETTQQQQSALAKQQVDETVERVLRDADARSKMLAVEGFTAGYDKGRFRLASSDGNFSFSPSLQLQFRNVTNWRQDTTGANEDEITNGFELRRARFGFDGVAFSKNLSYYFLWDTNRQGGGVTLHSAWVRYDFNDEWGIRGGQFLNPVFHEQSVSSRRQTAVDRSLANVLITGNDESKGQGVEVLYSNGPFNAEVGFGDGFTSDNTDFRDFVTDATTATTTGNNFDVYGRVNYFAFGDKKAYEDFSALNNKNDLLVFGAGIDFTQTGDSNQYRHTVDAQYEVGPVGLYGAFIANYVDAGGEDTYNYGAVGQVSYLFATQWEVFGRYDFSKFDDEQAVPGGTEDLFQEIVGGVNYYWFGHNAKFTVDAGWLPNGSPSNQSGLGILASGDDSVFVRAQFQLAL